MVIQLPRSVCNRRIPVPLLERLELLQAQELPELVHRAHAPAARLLHSHDFDHAEDFRRATGSIRSSAFFCCIVKDLGEAIIGERPIRLTLKPTWQGTTQKSGTMNFFANIHIPAEDSLRRVRVLRFE